MNIIYRNQKALKRVQTSAKTNHACRSGCPTLSLGKLFPLPVFPLQYMPVIDGFPHSSWFHCNCKTSLIQIHITQQSSHFFLLQGQPLSKVSRKFSANFFSNPTDKLSMEKHNLLGRGNNASDICTLKIKRLKLWLTQFPNKKQTHLEQTADKKCYVRITHDI